MNRKEGYKYVGENYPMQDAIDKVRGKAKYTTDIKLDGMVYAKMIYSTIGHGEILSMDTSEAEKMEGVLHVATPFNSPKKKFNTGYRFKGHKGMDFDEMIFNDKVRFYGDRIGAVVATSEAIAAKALKLIKIEYKEYDVVIDPKEALKEDAPKIHEKGNLLGNVVAKVGDTEKGFEEAEYIFEHEYKTPMVHHYAMEPHSALADWDGKNLTIWTCAQNIYAYRVILSESLGIPMNRIRIIKPVVGGGFGGKNEAVLEPAAAHLAIVVGRPVMMEQTRNECMVSSRTRHAAIVKVKTGHKEDGTLTTIQYDAMLNAGGYATTTLNVLGGMSAKCMMLYSAQNVTFEGTGVYTNSPMGGAMRGYGSPQVLTPLEMHMEEVAKELNIDPVKFKLDNLARPYGKHPRGGTFGNARVVDCLNKGLELFDWENKKKNVKSEGNIKRGIGFSTGVHGNGMFPKHIDCTTIEIKMTEDGKFILFTGNQDIGQGIGQALLIIAGEVLGVEPNSIELVESDTKITPFDLGTFSSRGTWVSGRAAKVAAEKMREKIIEVASQMLEIPKEDVKIGYEYAYSAKDENKNVSFEEIAIYAQQEICIGELKVCNTHYSDCNTGSYAADFAEVEVDITTGKVKVVEFVAVHDVGKAINPLMVEGQIEGGIQMGLGYGLTEELVLDPDTGKVKNAHTKKYPIFRANQMPKIKVGLVEEGAEPGPYGAKSIGEIATVPVAAAVISAVNNALGTNMREIPATPERVLKAIEEQSK
ncbi:molybdopterin-dependent oxidoreductase [Clostridium sediminicola]|uniref:xanthine dehydrogenase family protein molybdopterin-binding subunit n=1 Tax=Clostridium sediminicola TaxID=3114879 RepID=UPI0031F1DF66